MSETNFTEQWAEDFAKDQQKLELEEMLAKADNIVLGFVASTGATGGHDGRDQRGVPYYGEQGRAQIACYGGHRRQRHNDHRKDGCNQSH